MKPRRKQLSFFFLAGSVFGIYAFRMIRLEPRRKPRRGLALEGFLQIFTRFSILVCMWTFWIRMIRLRPRRKPRRGICHTDFEMEYRPNPGFPKHFIEVRPIPESSDPTQGVQAKCLGPWAQGPWHFVSSPWVGSELSGIGLTSMQCFGNQD